MTLDLDLELGVGTERNDTQTHLQASGPFPAIASAILVLDNAMRRGQRAWATAVPGSLRGSTARVAAQTLGRGSHSPGAHMQSYAILGARYSSHSMAGGHRALQVQVQLRPQTECTQASHWTDLTASVDPQELPGDAAVAHLASLASTPLMLKAVQGAYQARQRIVINSRPVEVETVWLYDQRNGPQPPPGFVLRQSGCLLVEHSPCGSFMGVVLEGALVNPGIKHKGRSTRMEVYHVVVYSTSGGMRELARFYTGNLWPTIQWSPSGHLCVAQLLRGKFKPSRDAPCCQLYGAGLVQELFTQSAAFVWDPKTAQIIQSLSSDTSSALRVQGRGCIVIPVWSPSCQYMLVTGDPDQGETEHDGRRRGWLLIADMSQGRIVAQCQTSMMPDFPIDCLFSAVWWHPSSKGLIFRCDVWLQDTAPILQAGFALGSLPRLLTMHAAGFCADATYLVARSTKQQYSPVEVPLPAVLVRCSMEGLHIGLDEGQPLVLQGSWNAEYLGWLPGCSTLFMECTVPESPMVRHVIWQHSACSGRWLPQPYGQDTSEDDAIAVNGPSQRYSPSGKLFVAADVPGLRIIDVKTCKNCWQAISKHTRLAEPSAWGLRGLPDCDPQPHAFQHVVHFEFCGWLPTGLGFVCSTWECFHRREERATCAPPALHCYRFAKP